MYSIKIANYAVSGFQMASEKPDCPKCPQCPICFSSCEWDEYVFNGLCHACHEDCTEGCVREENCNLCSDEECGVCSSFSPFSCEECIANASKDATEDCHCIAPNQYYIHENLCKTCHPSCNTCEKESSALHCNSCASGYLMLENSGICSLTCPTGFASRSWSCISEGDVVISVTFT